MTDRNRRFANKVVVITGAGSGIGRTAALAFAREGGSVVIGDINEADGRRDGAADPGGRRLRDGGRLRRAQPRGRPGADRTRRRRLRRGRRPLQQCRRGPLRHGRGALCRGLGLSDRHQPQGHVPDLQVRHPGDAQARRRRDRQHRLGAGVRLAEDGTRLRRVQGWRRQPDHHHRPRSRRRQHPLQLHRPRHDPHADGRSGGRHLRPGRSRGRRSPSGAACIPWAGSGSRRRSPISSSSWPATRPPSAPAAATASTAVCCRRCSMDKR